jgi:glyoxylase-like metal-dependent hydrolase (beta-lactamase superfamily II)
MQDDLIVEQLRIGPLWNFVYLVGSRAAGEALVIDPGAEIGPVLTRAEALGLRIGAAVATHFHTDHTAGLEALNRRTSAVALVHHADEGGLRRHYGGPVRAVADGERLRLGDHRVELWHAPGHTPGSQWLVVDGAVFTGDSLMVGCLGRTGHEPDAAERMWWTMTEQLPRLRAETRIYPGHDYGPEPSGTVGRERRRNPALRAARFSEFLAALTE